MCREDENLCGQKEIGRQKCCWKRNFVLIYENEVVGKKRGFLVVFVRVKKKL